MADLLAFHTFGHSSFLSAPAMLSRSNNHRRSASTELHRSSSPNRLIPRMKSSNALSDFRRSQRESHAGLEELPESNFSTLRDPRVASTTDLPQTAESEHHPDLNREVALLSQKLVQAINNQTSLDDSLAATRQELEQTRDRLEAAELENQKFKDDLAQGVLVRRSDIDPEIRSLKAAIAEERAQRLLAEQGKKNIEQELETLTAALFEEANKMVAAAKQEREAVERKNEQLRAQIRDTEMLVASQKEQLAELKGVMAEMNSCRDETDTHTNISTTPSSPAVNKHSSLNRFLDTSNFSPSSAAPDVGPAPSTQFPHLLKLVCRTDISAYEDFRDLLNQARSSKPASRVASGSYAGLNVMGLGSLAAHSGFSNASSVSLSGASQSPTPNGSPQPSTTHISLKETRFYKRILTEDIEPALRLDTAPSISWLTRRSVMSSICEGGLVVEPMPMNLRKYGFPCSLCGEKRQGNVNERTHRFRTSDNENAQRYPLCVLCLEKIRACCDLTGYLRMILDGHIRVGDEEEEKEAWEETVRLRERIFWARLGGGVVPAFIPSEHSAAGDEQRQRRSSKSPSRAPSTEAPVVRESPLRRQETPDDPFVSDAKHTSIGETVISAEGRAEVEADNQFQDVKEERTDKDDSQADSGSTGSHPADAQPADTPSDVRPSDAQRFEARPVNVDSSPSDANPADIPLPDSPSSDAQLSKVPSLNAPQADAPSSDDAPSTLPSEVAPSDAPLTDGKDPEASSSDSHSTDAPQSESQAADPEKDDLDRTPATTTTTITVNENRLSMAIARLRAVSLSSDSSSSSLR